jgi:hypothetical protein
VPLVLQPTLVRQVLPEQQDRRALLVQVELVQLVQPVLLAQLALLVPQATRAQPDPQEQLAQRVRQVLLAHQ